VGLRAGLDDVEKRKFLTLPGFDLRLLSRPARSQSLYRLRHPNTLSYPQLPYLSILSSCFLLLYPVNKFLLAYKCRTQWFYLRYEIKTHLYIRICYKYKVGVRALKLGNFGSPYITLHTINTKRCRSMRVDEK
jgi:hypothetical protein